MNQELLERVRRRCVGFADDPVALTKGEVLELIQEFNQDLDGLALQLADHEPSGRIRALEADLEFRTKEARKTASILNDKNFAILGYKERIRVLEEANELLRTNRDRANSEIVRLVRDASMSSQAICSLRAQLGKAKEKAEYLQKCGEENYRLRARIDEESFAEHQRRLPPEERL